MNDSGGVGIVGVIIGAVLVIGIIFFAFGDRLGMRGPSGNTTVKVESPKVPVPNSWTAQTGLSGRGTAPRCLGTVCRVVS